MQMYANECVQDGYDRLSGACKHNQFKSILFFISLQSTVYKYLYYTMSSIFPLQHACSDMSDMDTDTDTSAAAAALPLKVRSKIVDRAAVRAKTLLRKKRNLATARAVDALIKRAVKQVQVPPKKARYTAPIWEKHEPIEALRAGRCVAVVLMDNDNIRMLKSVFDCLFIHVINDMENPMRRGVTWADYDLTQSCKYLGNIVNLKGGLLEYKLDQPLEGEMELGTQTRRLLLSKKAVGVLPQWFTDSENPLITCSPAAYAYLTALGKLNPETLAILAKSNGGLGCGCVKHRQLYRRPRALSEPCSLCRAESYYDAPQQNLYIQCCRGNDIM
jgi:hypothetical protein